MNLTVKITGTQAELDRFKKLGSSLTNFSNAMKEVKSELKVFYSKAVIGSQGGAIGSKWAGLSPVYKKYKSKHYPGKPIGVASGEMQRNFDGSSDKTSATIINKKSYFQYFQQGTRRMPSRPIFGINKNVENIVTEIIDKDVHKKLEAA